MSEATPETTPGIAETGLEAHDAGAGAPGGAGGRVIKAATASAPCSGAKVYDLRPVRDLITAARRILNQAQDDAERIRRKAHREGFEAGRKEGLEKGRIQGIRQGLEEAGEIRRSLAALLEDLRQHRSALKADAETHMLNLAVAVAERILRVRLDDLDRTETLRRTVAEAVQLIAGAERIRIHLAPEDARALRDFLPEVAEHLDTDGTDSPAEAIELVPDPDITRGGCIVRTAGGAGEIDARIETQLEEIERQLKE